MPKIVNCRFCGIKNVTYERKFCSIECADLFDEPAFYGRSQYKIRELTPEQEMKLTKLLGDTSYNYVHNLK